MSDYNGWKNHATWNVALWIGGEESLYRIAVDYVRRYPNPSYNGLAHLLDKHVGHTTPDGVRWFDGDIDEDALTEMLVELLD